MRLAEDLAATAAFTRDQPIATFSRHIDPQWIEEALASTGTATVRRRRLPGEQVVWLVIGMALMRALSIVEIVRRLALSLPSSRGGNVAPSAVPQARARIGAEPIEWLFVRTATEWVHTSARKHAWRGLGLYGVDGSTLRVADSTANRAHFGGSSKGAHGRGPSGYPLVRVVTLMALRSHLVAAASFGPYGTDERVYATDLWSSVPDDSLVIMDRLYFAANVLLLLQAGGRNRHWMLRKKSTTKWTLVTRLGKGDHLVRMQVSSEARRKDPTLPSTFLARAIQYRRPGHAAQALLTSLTDAKRYPADELVALYHARWEIELGYDEIKTELLDREETIRSQSVAAVEQELWGILLAYNLVRVEMERIADTLGVEPTRISFIAALRFITEQWSWAAFTETPGGIPRRLDAMRALIARFVLPPRRSDRSFPRAVKVKMSSYALKRPARRRKPLK